jgi:HipA-like C-terminal domain
MRPKNQSARDQLLTVLARHPRASASALAEPLGVSVPTLHRLLSEVAEYVVATGKARRTRYALRRPLRGQAAELPLYEIDAAGAVPEESRDGWWQGLPYPLYDMRPQGYMGRQFARAEHRQLALPADPQAWSDDDIVFALSQRGADLSGNLILGNPAYERWQATRLAAPQPLRAAGVGRAYAALAEQAIAAGVAGSSAAGEFPKFTALRELAGSATPHVLVKFSGADGSAAVRRWADLLVCEHLALECVATLPSAQTARSRIVTHAGRTFLEVERFDRHGLFGRSRLCSLATLNAALVGEGSTDWVVLATRFAAAGLLSPGDVQRVDQLWWFGRLIANTDMHTGNLSFRPQQQALALAPAYDMLPMLYAPLPGGEVPPRSFEPRLPLPPQRSAWNTACAVAVLFWLRAAEDRRISDGFREACGANARRLQELAAHA